MENRLTLLQSLHENSDDIWFFVKSNFRILQFNKKAAANSIIFHNKKMAAGDSILDYARDTSNNIDSEFITCFGKAAAGQVISLEQQICYENKIIRTRSTYTPVYEGEILLGVSILVTDITVSGVPDQ